VINKRYKTRANVQHVCRKEVSIIKYYTYIDRYIYWFFILKYRGL